MNRCIKTCLFCLISTVILECFFTAQAAIKKNSIKNRNISEEIILVHQEIRKDIALSTGVNIIILMTFFWFIQRKQKRDNATVDWMLSETKSTLYHQHRQLKKQLKYQQDLFEKIASNLNPSASPDLQNTHEDQTSEIQDIAIQIDKNILID
ncbi:MAG: hypothetical protein AB8C84_01840 [Oligoflexales bacterium]